MREPSEKFDSNLGAMRFSGGGEGVQVAAPDCLKGDLNSINKDNADDRISKLLGAASAGSLCLCTP